MITGASSLHLSLLASLPITLAAVCRNEEITSRFAALDRDGNGVLSPEEVVNVIKEMMGFDEDRAVSLMQMFDQNQDGSLDKTEFMQLWASMFGR